MDLYSWARNKVASFISWWYGIEKLKGEDLEIVKKYLPIINYELHQQKTKDAMKTQIKKNILEVFRVAKKEELAKLLQIIIYNSEKFEKKLIQYDKSFNNEDAKGFFHQIKKFLADSIVSKLTNLDDKDLEEKIIAELDNWEFEPLKLVF